MFLLEEAADAMVTFCDKSYEIWQLVGHIVNIFKIVIPIIIVLLAMVDLGKAVMAGEEKEIKTAQKMLIKRLIYGVVIFFVVTLVQTAFGLLGTRDTTNGRCWACAIDPTGASCTTGTTANTQQQ